jgi:hypothetical protein
MKLILRSKVNPAKTIKLDFDGYYDEDELPPLAHDCAGVYVVYKGLAISEKQCKLHKLLYIGRSGDLTGRPSPSHHKYSSWRRRLKDGEVLFFSFANTDDEKRAEAALIYRIQPICNDTGKDGFHHPETTIETSGANDRMESSFTVQKTD